MSNIYAYITQEQVIVTINRSSKKANSGFLFGSYGILE